MMFLVGYMGAPPTVTAPFAAETTVGAAAPARTMASTAATLVMRRFMTCLLVSGWRRPRDRRRAVSVGSYRNYFERHATDAVRSKNFYGSQKFYSVLESLRQKNDGA